LKPPTSQGTIWAGSVKQASNAGARFSGLDQFPVEPNSTQSDKPFKENPMMRFIFVMIAALAFAGCAKNPTVCEGRISDFIGIQSLAKWAVSETDLTSGLLQEIVQTILENGTRQTKFERCLEDQCGTKDSCGKEDKKCLETYEACISDQTSLSRWDWLKTEPIATLDPYFGLDWWPYFAVIFLILWINLKYPNPKWGRKSWESEKWHKKARATLWLMVTTFVIYSVINAALGQMQITTVGFMQCLLLFASLYGRELGNGKKVLAEYHRVELVSDPVPGSATDPVPAPSSAPAAPQERRCSKCGVPASHADPFCDDCGGPITDGTPAPASPQVRRCSKCGVPASHADPFCDDCGGLIG